MLIQRKKRYLFSVFLFLFLCIATVVGFYLLKSNQDTRQQASTGSCPANDPYCNGLPTPPPTTAPNSPLNDKGIVSTTYTGTRPTTKSGCGGVWMNEFCYMPGDELAGGKIIVDSGRYSYPYIEDKKVYESVNFGAESVSKVVGSTESLGKDCNGQGVAIGNTCYAYGATVNGYLVVPPRTTGCSNTAGDYCYAHLEKIEVSYDDWQAAVTAYKNSGDTKALEDLYQKTYGVSFTAGSLYDPNSANADLLKAQAILSALTNASVLQAQAAAQNAELTAKGNLTASEQALFDFNQQIIADKNLATRYQVLDQLNDSSSQQLTMDTAIKQMYSTLVVAGNDANLDKIAAEQFKAIFGYDPSEKFGNVNGILESFGIDPAQFNADRAKYSQQIAAQTQDFDKLNQEYQDYISGSSENINELKNAAIDAGVVTADQLKNLSEAEILALLLSKFSDTTPVQAQQEATAIVDARQNQVKEQQLTSQYIDHQGSAASYSDLVSLYTLYTGHAPRGQFSEAWLQEEVAKYNSQVALSMYAQTQDVIYLQNYYKNSTDAYNGSFVPTDEKALLNGIYGNQVGAELYSSIVLPARFNEAVANFPMDGGNDLAAVCKELKVTDCSINSEKATQTMALMLDKIYEGNTEVNIPDMAVSYSNQIYANTQKQETQSFWDLAFANFAMAQTADSASAIVFLGEDSAVAQNFQATMDYQSQAMDNYSTAIEASKIFNASQTFDYATDNRTSLNDYTWGMSYGNALMADNIFNREFTPEEMNLNFGQTVNLTFNQLSSQIANVDVAQNIAANYATSKHYGYIGPADTGISNIALFGADNMGVLDYNYQAAESGYYVDKTFKAWGEDIGAAMTEAGAMYAASQMNEAAANQAMFSGGENIEFIDPIEYADQANQEFKADYHQNMMDSLYNNYVANAEKAGIDQTQQATFEQFFNDPEIQRSSQQLNYERLEKVVAPAAAIVVLPAMVASGVGVPVLLGAASSAFSLYQGAGMKAQALEIQRIDIDSRENAIIQSYIDSGASAADVEEMRTDLEIQAAALNQQGNMMLANSAVAAFTSAGGWATSLAGAANAATTANALATTGQVLTKVGQVGGIALNSYNAVNSGISSYNAFQEGNIGGGVMSGISSFVAASGVAGNTFGLLGPTTYTNKIDYVLDAMNVPAGAAVDAQQVAQACYGKSGAFSEKDCTNAWIGLALSAGQNVSQISSSYKAYKGDIAAGQTADLQKQIDAIDMEIIALNGPNKGLREGLQINDLMLQRTKLADQIAGIDPNIKIANNTPTEDFLAAGIRISADLEARAQAARDAGQNDLADNLTRQAEVFRDKPIAVDAVRSQIADIDAQISKRGVLMPESEVADLQQKRAVLVNDMENLVKDLSVVDSMRQQNEALLKTTKENTAMAEYEQLMKIGKENADLVARYAPETGEVIKYTSDLEKNAANIKLEVDSNKRLLSIAALQDGLSRINDLEAQRQALARDLGADSSEIDATITRLDAEISKLNEQGVLDAEQTVKLEDLQNQKLDLQAERNRFSAIDDEISGIRKITDVMSADNRSPWQKFTDLFSPGKKTRDAYYESLALTREAEAIKAKLAGVGADSDDARAFREQLADVNRRLIGQQAILADARANPSKGVFRTVADFFGGIVQNREVANLKNLAKKLGTSNLDIAEKMSAKQVEINKLNDEDPVANADRIKALEADIADLRKTSQTVLRGKNALIAVDQSDKFTQYKLTDAGKKAGLNEAHLKILNDELKAFEQFRRDTGTPGFKIYSNTGSFKDQDVFLLAEIEALGAGRRGTVFGALPGMGKTDVVMPFNVLLKQRMTNASQFVVFPEAKLMKPWASDANYTPNKDFIAYVESRFGEGSVVIVKAGDQSIDPAVIARAKFVITTKDVAFDLQSTDTRLGLNLRDKWRNSYVHADEVDWTFNPNENYKLSGQQVALRDKAEFGLYLDAQKQVLGIDENGNMPAGTGLSSLRALINELSLSKSIPEGITRTSDGKGGKFADPVLEKQVLSEWLDTWGGQSKIPGLDMSADSEVIKTQINDYLTRGSDADVHQHRAEMAMINETVNFLSRVPGEDYGMTSNSRLVGDVEEIINSIAPREQGRVSGRSYSAVAESLLYNTLGARVLGVNGDVDVNRLTVGENGSEINYALLMLESKGFSLYTGTPETVAKLYKMAYGIDLKVFTDSAVDDSIARFNAPPAGTDSKIFVSLQDQIAARLGDGRNQVFVNMASGVRSNEAALNDLVRTVNETGAGYQKLFVVGANGELVEYQMTGGTLSRVDGFANTDALNARTTDLDKAGERYIKFYEYGAHVGVDTVNNVAISRAVGLCSGCDETTFSQGINRIRVKVEVKDGTSTVEYAPIDIVWMDAPAGNRNPGISDFSDSINGRQVINEALAEVSFKETLLKNSVDATFAELIDLAKNGKKGFLGFGAYEANKDVVAQLEAAQQKWKETTGMNYLLGSDDMTAQAKLEKTAAQVSAAYDELTRMLAGSGEPAKLLAKRADGAVGDNPIRLAFSGDEGYQVLGENPSYRQIVDLINQSSKHLESVNIAFTNKSSPAEVVQSEIAKVVADAESGSQVKVDDGGPDTKNPDTTGPDTAGPDRNGDAPVGGDDGIDQNKPAPVGPVVDEPKDDKNTNNNAPNNPVTNRASMRTFGALLSSLWSGTVDEEKLLAENTDKLEENKQAVVADYQAQIDKLKDDFAKTSDQTEKDSITSQIESLEIAKTNDIDIDLAAKVMTTEQLAQDYRVGGIKNFLNNISIGNSEKSGGLTIRINPLATNLSETNLFTGGFDEKAFLADNQAEIDVKAEQLKQAAVEPKLAEMQAILNEIEKLNQEIGITNDPGRQSEILAAMEVLSEKSDKLAGEVLGVSSKDFLADATNQVREKYANSEKYLKIGLGQQLLSGLVNHFNFQKAVQNFNEAYNSTEETWGSKLGNFLALRVKAAGVFWNGTVDEESLLLDHADEIDDVTTKEDLIAKYANFYKFGGLKNAFAYSGKIDLTVQERLLTEKISPEDFLKNRFGKVYSIDDELVALRKTKPNSRERFILRKLFRERYSAQLKGITLYRQEVEKAFNDSPNLTLEDLRAIFNKYRGTFALNDDIGNFTESFYEKYQKQLEKISQVKASITASSEEEFVEDVLDYKPSKQFSINYGNDYVAIIVSDEDYKNLFGDSEGIALSSRYKFKLKLKSKDTSFLSADNLIMVVNEKHISRKSEIIAHERQHILHGLLVGSFDIDSIKAVKMRAADEIMAYFEDGELSPRSIDALLATNLDGSEKEDYDFFAWADISDLTLKKKYNKDLSAAINAYKRLLNSGFSNAEIRAMFEMEDLSKWPKIANRLTNIYFGKNDTLEGYLAYGYALNLANNRPAVVRFFADRFNLKKAVENFQIALNSKEETWLSKKANSLALGLKDFASKLKPIQTETQTAFSPKIPMWNERSLTENADRITKELRAEAIRQGMSEEEIDEKIEMYSGFFEEVPVVRLTDNSTVDKLIQGEELLSAYQVAGKKDIPVGHTSQSDIDRGLNHYVFGSWGMPEGFSSDYGSTMVVIDPSTLQEDSTVVTVHDHARIGEEEYKDSAVRGKDFVKIMTLAAIITHKNPLDALSGQVNSDKDVSEDLGDQISKWQNFAEVKILDKVSSDKVLALGTNDDAAKTDVSQKVINQKKNIPVYSQNDLVGKNTIMTPNDMSRMSWNIRRASKGETLLTDGQNEKIDLTKALKKRAAAIGASQKLLDSFTTEEEVDNWLAEQTQKFTKLGNLFKSLGASVPAIASLSDYQNQFDVLSRLISEIQNLEVKSGLKYFTYDLAGATDLLAVNVTLVNPDLFDGVDDFRTKAKLTIEAKENETNLLADIEKARLLAISIGADQNIQNSWQANTAENLLIIRNWIANRQNAWQDVAAHFGISSYDGNESLQTEEQIAALAGEVVKKLYIEGVVLSAQEVLSAFNEGQLEAINAVAEETFRATNQGKVDEFISRIEPILSNLEQDGAIGSLVLSQINENIAAMANAIAFFAGFRIEKSQATLLERAIQLANMLELRRENIIILRDELRKLKEEYYKVTNNNLILDENIDLNSSDLLAKINEIQSLIDVARIEKTLAMAKTRAISELLIEEKSDVFNRIQAARNIEEVEKIIQERRGLYKNLESQMVSIGAHWVLTINNERYYQQQLALLGKIVAEIEDLQLRTGFKYLETMEDGKVQVADGGFYSINRSLNFADLEDFRTKANAEVEKLATEEADKEKVDSFIAKLEPTLSTLESANAIENMTLDEISTNAREISNAIAFFTSFNIKDSRVDLFSRIETLSEALEAQRLRVVSSREKLRKLAIDYADIEKNYVYGSENLDVNNAKLNERFLELEKLVAAKRLEIANAKPKKPIATLPQAEEIIQNLANKANNDRTENQDIYEVSLDKATEILSKEPGIIRLTKNKPILVISDLHTRGNFLINALNQPVKTSQGQMSVLEALSKDLVQVVLLGDGMHSEVKDNWTDIDVMDIANSAKMEKEMARSLNMMAAIMDLKVGFPDSFHYIKGNHDNMNVPFVKYAAESVMVSLWMKQRFGEDFVTRWKAFEQSLPLMAVQENEDGSSRVFTHAAPKAVIASKHGTYDNLSLTDIESKTEKAYWLLTWADNTDKPSQLEYATNPVRVGEMMDSLLKDLDLDPEKSIWMIGHRDVDEDKNYRVALNNRLIQIDSKTKYLSAIIYPEGNNVLIRDVNPVTNNGKDTNISPLNIEEIASDFKPKQRTITPIRTQTLNRDSKIASLEKGVIYSASSEVFEGLKNALSFGRDVKNNFAINNDFISRNHLVIFHEKFSFFKNILYPSKDRWVMRDLGSRNGTVVGKIPLIANMDYEVLPNLEIRFETSGVSIKIIKVNETELQFQVIDKAFDNLCSDCNSVREAVQNGVSLADDLLAESEELLRQAEAARISGNQNSAKDLINKSEIKKQAALTQLNQTRFQVVNDHGMQNQCVQLYLNAWVDVREAKIRQTLADTNNAIKAVINAAEIVNKTLSNGFMEINSTDKVNLNEDDVSRLEDMRADLGDWSEELNYLRDVQIANGSKIDVLNSLRIQARETYLRLKRTMISTDQSSQEQNFISQLQNLVAGLQNGGVVGSMALSELNANMATIVDGIEYIKYAGLDDGNLLSDLTAFVETLQNRNDYLLRLRTKLEALMIQYKNLTGNDYILSDVSQDRAAKVILQIDKLQEMIKSHESGSGISAKPTIDQKVSEYVIGIKDAGYPEAMPVSLSFSKNGKPVQVVKNTTVADLDGVLDTMVKDASDNFYIYISVGNTHYQYGAAFNYDSTKPVNFQVAANSSKQNMIDNLQSIISKKSSGVKNATNARKDLKLLGVKPLNFVQILYNSLPSGDRVKNFFNGLSAGSKRALAAGAAAAGSGFYAFGRWLIKKRSIKLKPSPEFKKNVVESGRKFGQFLKSIRPRLNVRTIVISVVLLTIIYLQFLKPTPPPPVPTGTNSPTTSETAGVPDQGPVADVPAEPVQQAPAQQAPIVAAAQDKQIDSTKYVTDNKKETARISEEFLTVGDADGSNICGPLAAKLMQDGGYLDQSINIHDFWLLNDYETGDYATMPTIKKFLPADKYDWYSTDQSVSEFNFNLHKLKVGDLMLLHGDEVMHWLTITRIDDQGRVYATTNIQAGYLPGNDKGDRSWLIQEVMVYDPQNPEAGQFAKWTNTDEYGALHNIGEGGFRIWSLKDGPDSITIEESKVVVSDVDSKPINYFFANDVTPNAEDDQNFKAAFSTVQRVGKFLDTDEIRVYKKKVGTIPGGRSLYGISGVGMAGDRFIGEVTVTDDYLGSDYNHFYGPLSQVGLADRSPEAAIIHEIAHLMKFKKVNGSLVESDLFKTFESVFYGGNNLSEKAPTDYSSGKYGTATEDFADSVALYLVAPEYLKKVAPERYAFMERAFTGGDFQAFQLSSNTNAAITSGTLANSNIFSTTVTSTVDVVNGGKLVNYTMDTSLPSQYKVAHPFAAYEMQPDGKILLTERDEWLNVDPSLFPSYGANRNADDYLKTIQFFQVEKSARYKKSSGLTYCNIFVSDVTTALGVSLPRWMNGDKTDATQLLGWIGTDEAHSLGWSEEITAEQAQANANAGIPTVAITEGHIAMVIPGEGVTVGGEFFPSSAQAGRLNFENGTTYVGFGKMAKGQTIHYFSNASHYQLTAPPQLANSNGSSANNSIMPPLFGAGIAAPISIATIQQLIAYVATTPMLAYNVATWINNINLVPLYLNQAVSDFNLFLQNVFKANQNSPIINNNESSKQDIVQLINNISNLEKSENISELNRAYADFLKNNPNFDSVRYNYALFKMNNYEKIGLDKEQMMVEVEKDFKDILNNSKQTQNYALYLIAYANFLQTSSRSEESVSFYKEALYLVEQNTDMQAMVSLNDLKQIIKQLSNQKGSISVLPFDPDDFAAEMGEFIEKFSSQETIDNIKTHNRAEWLMLIARGNAETVEKQSLQDRIDANKLRSIGDAAEKKLNEFRKLYISQIIELQTKTLEVFGTSLSSKLNSVDELNSDPETGNLVVEKESLSNYRDKLIEQWQEVAKHFEITGYENASDLDSRKQVENLAQLVVEALNQADLTAQDVINAFNTRNSYLAGILNLQKTKFASLCSDCETVRTKTAEGVQIADALFAESQALALQAQSSTNQAVAKDLYNQAELKKQAALKQLNDTRNKVINEHGFQNQCVQTYLNAYVNTHEALIRKTKADVDLAIDSVYRATTLALQLKNTGKMTIKEGGLFGLFAKSKHIDLDAIDLEDINDLLEGNEAKGIEGLNSFATFEKINDHEISRKIIGGSLIKMENSVISDNVSGLRVSFRNFYQNAKNAILLSNTKNDVKNLINIKFTWKFAKPKFSIVLPKINLPKISVPKVSLPKISLPKISIPKNIDFSKVKTIGGVIAASSQNFFKNSGEFIKKLEIKNNAAKSWQATSTWFKSILPKKTVTPAATKPLDVEISITPIVSVSITPPPSRTPTPTITITPTPTPRIIFGEESQDMLRNIWRNIFGVLKYLWKFRLLAIYDAIYRVEEVAIIYFQINDYKDDLPAYDPNSEESREMAANGIYTDYICNGNTAFSKDLTKSSNNLTKIADCNSGCYKGACVASVGDKCNASTDIIYASKENECLMVCNNGSFSETATCGHVKVDAYSNKAYWEIYQSLEKIPEDIARKNNINIYATWKPDLDENDDRNLITSGFAMSNGMNVKPIVIAGGYSGDLHTVTHEYFHIYGANEHRLYPDWAPFAIIVSLPETIMEVSFGTANIATPQSYIEAMGFSVKKFVGYNELGNEFVYGPNAAPIIGYGDLNPNQIVIGEDFASSAAWYINEPCQLRSKSPVRYEYFKNETFGGREFIPPEGCTN